MSATVLIKEKNGAGETATDKTSGTIRFRNADTTVVDLTSPMVKPGAGLVDRSYEKWLRLNISVAAAGNITSPKFYTDGTQSNTGVTVYAKTTNPSAYSTPAEAANDTGYTDAFTYNSGSPKALDVANAGPYTGTGDKGDYLVLMMKIDENVTAPGALTAETLTFQWDET